MGDQLTCERLQYKNPGNHFRDSIDALKFVYTTNFCNGFLF
jgi:hypothetical protein